MKISAINNYAYQHKSNLGFNGLLISKGLSSSNFDDYQNNIYYPFKDESKESIEKNLKDNNYSYDYGFAYNGGYYVSTSLGKTLPFTEKEWNKLSKDNQEKIKTLL